MNTIAIKNGEVEIRSAATTGVWLTQNEIAALFGVFTSAVRANIRTILQKGILREDKVFRRFKTDRGYIERYNLEMIVTLAFRLHSENAEIFRRWIIQRATTPVVVWGLLQKENSFMN